jgi:hypothetical protein
MSARIERLKTPPPTLGVANGQLLTPPLTGGSNKRVRFDLDPATPSKRFQSSEKAEEYGLATYTELQESNDEDEELSVSIDTSEDSDGSPPPISSSSLASVVSSSRRPSSITYFAYRNTRASRMSSQILVQLPKLSLSPSRFR